MTIDSQRTTRLPFAMLTANLATATTLAAATRHDFAAVTMYAPESPRSFAVVDGGRVIVRVRAYFNGATISDLDGVRIGIKIGAVAFDDLDVTVAIASTGNHWHLEFSRDVTAYFATNDPATASFAVQVGVAFATGAASTVTNVCAELVATYGFDSSSATYAGTAQFPIQSHHTTPVADGVSFTEIGTAGGAANAPANQIRQLTDTGGAFDGIAGWVLRHRYLIITAHSARSSTGTTSVRVRFDGGGATTYSVAAPAAATSTKVILFVDISALATNAAHSLEIGTDVASMEHVGAIDVVVYEQTKPEPGDLDFVSLMLPLVSEHAGDTSAPFRQAALADADRLSAIFEVPEPSPVIDRCGVVLFDGLFTGGFDTLAAATGQTSRTYDRGTVGARDSAATIIHRTDHSSSDWAIVHGRNRLSVNLWQSATVNSIGPISGYAIVNYRTRTHPGGAHRHNRTVLLAQVLSYAEGASASLTPDEPVIPASPYRLSGALVQATAWHTAALQHLVVGALRLLGEDSGGGYMRAIHLNGTNLAELGSNEMILPCSSWWRPRSPTSVEGGADLEAERKWNSACSSLAIGMQAVLWGTYHACTFTVAGAVTIAGLPAADGKLVRIFAHDAYGSELVDAVAVSGGAFTAEVLDDSRSYFASYDNDSLYGRSKTGVPGVDSFPIVVATSLAPVLSNITPEPLPAEPGEAGAFSLDFRVARLTPIEFDITNITQLAGITILVSYADRNEMYAALDADGGWRWPFDVAADNTIGALASEPVHVRMLPRGGWPPTVIRFQVAAVRASA